MSKINSFESDRIVHDYDVLELKMEVQGAYLKELDPKNKLTSFPISKLKLKHISRLNWLIFIMVIGVVTYMFHLKAEVQDLTYEYNQIISQIDGEKKQKNLLKAELAYLNSPIRLKALVAQYLKLDNVKPEQIVATKKEGNLGEKKFASLSNKKNLTRWRYKRGNSAVRTASTTGEDLKKLRIGKRNEENN